MRTLPEHLSSPLVCSGISVARSLVFCVVFCRSLFVFLSLSFGHCIVFSSSIYGNINKNIFEDTNEVIRIHKSKKNRQYNGQKKRNKKTNNDLQNTTQKTKDAQYLVFCVMFWRLLIVFLSSSYWNIHGLFATP
jgi:hypothetical protein